MRRWISWLLGLTALASIIAAYPLSVASPEVRDGALMGWSVSFAMSLASGILVFRSLGYSQRGFLIATFGGMLLRLLIVSAAVVLFVAVFRVHVISFLVGLLGGYTLYHALEVITLQRHRSLTAVPGSGSKAGKAKTVRAPEAVA